MVILKKERVYRMMCKKETFQMGYSLAILGVMLSIIVFYFVHHPLWTLISVVCYGVAVLISCKKVLYDIVILVTMVSIIIFYFVHY